MIIIKPKPQTAESVRILLIGNNPIEMSSLLDVISKIPDRSIITEIAFDVKSITSRLLKFDPTLIFIDDNIGQKELSLTIHSLSNNIKTREVPITVIKNSNYTEALASADILDYLLKINLTTESIYNTIKNTLKFKRTRKLLAEAYFKRKVLLMKLTGS